MPSRLTNISGLILFFILIAGASGYLTLRLIVKSEKVVIVPNLVGKSVVEALETLTGLGLNTKILDSEFSSVQPRDHVLFQEPDAGAEIKVSRDVRIIVSKGQKGIAVPELRDLPYREAAVLLENHSLCVGEKSYAYHGTWLKDRIIAHTPGKGAEVVQGECVSLLISKGKRLEAILMPDLRGLSPDDAITEIDLHSLVLGGITSRYQEDQRADVMLDQRPYPGHRVVEGMAVHLVRNRADSRNDSYGPEPSEPYRLLRYRSDSGFINRRIRIQLMAFGLEIDLYDSFVRPGEEMWWIIPGKPTAKVTFHIDGDQMMESFYSIWRHLPPVQQAIGD